MRLRLIQPPLVQPRWRQLTLPVVAAELGPFFEVEICDENVEALDTSPVDLVGITCHVYNAQRAFEIARFFRERGVPVMIGGTFATVAPHLVAPHCDAVVVGELEGQSGRIAADAQAGRLRPIYRAVEPPSLEATARPAWELLDSRRYLRFNFPLELSRGCRFDCAFCTSRVLYPRSRTRSLDDIARDLAQHDHGQVELVDQNFLNERDFFFEVLPVLQRAPIPGWFGQTTLADLVDDLTLADHLAASRCRSLFVGLETVSVRGLRALNKAWSRPGRFAEVVKRFQERGVLIQAGLMVGLETDCREVFDQTLALLSAAKVHAVSVAFFHAYPGTSLYERLERDGRLLTKDWSRLDGNEVVIDPGQLDAVALGKEVRRFLRKLYGMRSILARGSHRGLRSPGQVAHHIAVNTALRSYYRTLEARWRRPGGGMGAAYGGGFTPSLDVALHVANVSSRLTEGLWRLP